TPRFCCSGCEAVYHILKQDGYTRYYDILKQTGTVAPKPDPFRADDGLADPDIWATPGKPGVLSLYIPSMTCAACVWLLETATTKLNGVAQARVNIEDRVLSLRIHAGVDAPTVLSSVIKTLASYGYSPIPVSRRNPSLEFRSSLIR